MRVLAFIGDTMAVMEIGNSLDTIQEFVGGFFEVVAITEEIDLICNEDFLFQRLEPRVVIDNKDYPPTIICGDCFICRHNRKGEFESIQDKDLKAIQEKVIHLDTEFAKLLAMLAIVAQ